MSRYRLYKFNCDYGDIPECLFDVSDTPPSQVLQDFLTPLGVVDIDTKNLDAEISRVTRHPARDVLICEQSSGEYSVAVWKEPTYILTPTNETSLTLSVVLTRALSTEELEELHAALVAQFEDVCGVVHAELKVSP
jgi:hypothetical protein